MKKIALALLLAVVSSTAAFAQFEKGKKYVGLNLSEFGLSYSKATDFSMGIGANAGYYVADNVLLKGDLGVTYANQTMGNFHIGAQGRYTFQSCGIFAQANTQYVHTAGMDDFQVGPEVGWTYFLNKNLTIEPSVYVDFSTCHFSDLTKFGLRVGLGWYF